MALKVNGKNYDWGDVDVKFPGLVLQLQEISYDDELEMEESYGRGSHPRGYGTGNYKASGKVSMLRDDCWLTAGQKGSPFIKSTSLRLLFPTQTKASERISTN